MATYGYMRVSTQMRGENEKSQTFDRQELILKEYGVPLENIYCERISGGVATRERKEWERLMEVAKNGDTIVVTEMSRLARSLGDLITTTNDLIKRGIAIRFLKENINVGNDGMDAMNKLMFNMFGAFAEFEKNIISDRTKQGLQAKKALGVRLGRPQRISQEIRESVLNEVKQGKTYQEIANQFNISKGTITQIVRKEQQ
jgi:DNA invertase Pin-like site-specific DNA recombinase